MSIRKLDKAEGWIDRTLGNLMSYPKTARVVFIVGLLVIVILLLSVAT